MPGQHGAYAGSDETLTCICPAELTGTGAVWGTDAYTADSATCRAALHAGATGRRGGTVTAAHAARPSALSRDNAERGAEHELRELGRRLPLRGRAAGRRRRGAAGSAAAAAAPTQCPDNLSAYEGSDERLACICSPERLGAGAVWGTDTYTADSATCRAALHAGAAGRRGGTFPSPCWLGRRAIRARRGTACRA